MVRRYDGAGPRVLVRLDRDGGGKTPQERNVLMTFARSLAVMFHNVRGIRVVGHVDTIQDGALHGWVWQPSAPETRLLVDVFVDGAFFDQQLAHRFRADLVAGGIGDGYYGFESRIEGLKEPPARVEVFALGETRLRLASSLFHAADAPPPVQTALDYVRTTFSTPETLHDDAQQSQNRNHIASSAPLFERLFASSPIPSKPVALGSALCAYLDLIRFKSDKADTFDTSLTIEQYRDYLRWYLSRYGKSTGRDRAPLSAADIAFLNAPEADGRSMSRAQHLWQSEYDLKLGNGAHDIVFAWNAFVAPAMCVEDCLIPHRDIAVLSEVVSEAPFPLTRFMIDLLRLNPFLKNLPQETADERAFITFVFLLLATHKPHFLKFQHAQTVSDFFLPTQGETAFDRHWRQTFSQAADNPLPSRRWLNTIDRSGYDVTRHAFRSITAAGSRLASPQIAVRAEPAVDVQIFGPFSRALGVGQSCRRLAAALETLNYTTRLCDFSRGHPNDRDASYVDVVRPPGRTRINIIHVNLEDVPAVVAYSPDVFSEARNIALPYLELSPLSSIQYLGLSLVDEVWAATRFVADTIKPHKPASIVVGTAVGPFAIKGRAAARREAYGAFAKPGDFIYLTAGDALSGADRKNPIGAIRSFLIAFPTEPHVKLFVKTHSTGKIASAYEQAIWQTVRDIAASDARVVLLDQLLSEDQHHALIEGADCYVSLHRSEGLGYHILEAMYFKVPVISTAYSGPTDFCSEQTAYLNDFRLVHVDPRQYHRANAEQVWAEPDYGHAARQMTSIFRDRTRRDAIVENAFGLVNARYSVESFGKRIDERLRVLLDRPLQ